MKTQTQQIAVSTLAEVTAIGTAKSGNRKPVLCITTGEIFASCKDAAEHFGVHNTAISMACLGKIKKVKGNEFCHVSQTKENLGRIANALAGNGPAPELKPEVSNDIVAIKLKKESTQKVSFRKRLAAMFSSFATRLEA